jgi:hypothetical protein
MGWPHFSRRRQLATDEVELKIPIGSVRFLLRSDEPANISRDLIDWPLRKSAIKRRRR